MKTLIYNGYDEILNISDVQNRIIYGKKITIGYARNGTLGNDILEWCVNNKIIYDIIPIITSTNNDRVEYAVLFDTIDNKIKFEKYWVNRFIVWSSSKRPYWTSSRNTRWGKQRLIPEVANWFRVNKIKKILNYYYIEFESEEDAMAFKLRWL